MPLYPSMHCVTHSHAFSIYFHAFFTLVGQEGRKTLKGINIKLIYTLEVKSMLKQ